MELHMVCFPNYEARGPEASELRLAIAITFDEIGLTSPPEYVDFEIIHSDEGIESITMDSPDKELENAFFKSEPENDNWEILAATN